MHGMHADEFPSSEFENQYLDNQMSQLCLFKVGVYLYPKECEKKNELVLVVGQELIQWPCSECVLWNLLLVVDATSCPSIHPSIATSCPSVHPFIFRSCFHSALPLGFRCCVASLSRTDKTTKPLCLCLCRLLFLSLESSTPLLVLTLIFQY